MTHLRIPFNVWLEREHPDHTDYDIDITITYESWKDELFEAYNAGYNFCRIEFEAGM